MRYWLSAILIGSLNIAAVAYAGDSRCAASIDSVQPKTAEMRLCQRNGTVLSIIHYK